jgi:ADP-ribose pyrophosphatase
MNKETKILGEGKFLRLVDNVGWEYVERKLGSGVVVIVAVWKGSLILVEQHRASVGRSVVELPAGLVGDVRGQEQEKLEKAAERELLEETGFQAGRMTYLTEGPPSSGLSGEIVSFFFASDLKKIGDGGGDEHEDIQVHLVPLPELLSWTAQKFKTGALVDPKIFAGVYFAHEDLK